MRRTPSGYPSRKRRLPSLWARYAAAALIVDDRAWAVPGGSCRKRIWATRHDGTAATVALLTGCPERVEEHFETLYRALHVEHHIAKRPLRVFAQQPRDASLIDEVVCSADALHVAGICSSWGVVTALVGAPS